MSLRERKMAQTKIAIMEAVIAMLAERPLAELSVREISEVVNISEMTFFNYFPSKSDVVVYFVQVWSMRVQWEMDRTFAAKGSYLEAIEALFAETARVMAQSPGVMAEIVAFQALKRAPVEFQPMGQAEYEQLFPGRKGIEAFKPRGVSDLLRQMLLAAVEAGELPPGSNIEVALVMLANTFFGTPLVAREGRPEPWTLYRQQLALVWRGLRA